MTHDERLLSFLNEHNISFARADHRAVFTCEEARQHVPPLPGAPTKNLFLRDAKGERHFLVVLPETRSVALSLLGAVLHVKKLSFASADRLQRYLGISPGAVSLLALLNDAPRAVECVIDADIWGAEAVLCHPLVNTVTLSIPQAGVRRFLELTGHAPSVLTLGSEDKARTV